MGVQVGQGRKKKGMSIVFKIFYSLKNSMINISVYEKQLLGTGYTVLHTFLKDWTTSLILINLWFQILFLNITPYPIFFFQSFSPAILRLLKLQHKSTSCLCMHTEHEKYKYSFYSLSSYWIKEHFLLLCLFFHRANTA